MKTLFVPVLAALTLALPLPASALLCLGCHCSVSITAVNFGAYAPLSGSPGLATGNVAMSCTGTAGLVVNYAINLGKGNNSAGFSPRKMASGSNRLNYDLYTDPSHNSIWGDGSSGSHNISGSALLVLLGLLGAVTVNHPVYGQIPASQKSVPPGSYSDAVVVTITYN